MSLVATLRDAITESETDTPADATTSPEVSMALDDALRILSNDRRRSIISVLARVDTTTKSDLAEHVASLENQTRPRHLTADERKRVYISLHQDALPRLDAVGLVNYDAPRGTIETTPRAGLLHDAKQELEAVLGGDRA